MTNHTSYKETISKEYAGLYAEYAKKYVEHHTGIAEEIAKVANIKKKDHILEIGVGTGASTNVFLSYLGKKGILDGIDISTNMLYFFRKNVKSNKIRKMINGDAKDIEKYFSEYKYDKILCSNSFWCIRDLNKFLFGASKLLKQDGRLIFSIYGTKIINYNIPKIERMLRLVKMKYLENESRILLLNRTDKAKETFMKIMNNNEPRYFVKQKMINRIIERLKRLKRSIRIRLAWAIWNSKRFKNIQRTKNSFNHTVPVMIYSTKLL
jgi:ubiquinone/menaquinone biosynthesis C-methylase UbiE